mgnify:CR=1 FL=1
MPLGLVLQRRERGRERAERGDREERERGEIERRERRWEGMSQQETHQLKVCPDRSHHLF